MKSLRRRHFFAIALALSGGAMPRPAAQAPAIRMRDVARKAGVDFVLEHHPTGQKHLIETMPGGLAAFDYNNDGRTDIFFANGATVPSLEKSLPGDSNRLFRNDGGMKFTDVTGEAGLAGAGYSIGVAAADYDNDGFVDLFVAGVNRNTLYRNLGDGRFADVTSRAGIRGGVWSVGGGWLDYDNDGLLDLFVVNYVRWSPEANRFCGDPANGLRVYCHPRFFEGLPNTLYRNRGDGTFEDVSAVTGIAGHVGKGMSVAIADYDGDGYMDIFVANDAMPNFLFHNRGGRSFEEVALTAGVALPDTGHPVSGMGSDFRDYDNDGLPDIHVTALNGQTFPLFRNRGKGLFLDATDSSSLGRLSLSRSGWCTGFVDLDNDGWKDIFTANSHVNDMVERFEASTYKQANSIFRNLGDGKFTDVSPDAGPEFRLPHVHRGCAFADFNQDGRMDVVVSTLGEPAELWENASAAGNWLIVRLEGKRSNRDGIGAVIRVGEKSNHMTTAVGYASTSHHGVHFGLGKMARVPRVEVRWPSGAVQTLRDLAANQALLIREPEP